jgi:hypothetical protein
VKVRKGYKLRLPVRVVDGVIEFEFGGLLPAKQNAFGELIIDQSAITDQAFLERMTRRRIVKLLPEGAQLYVMMSSRQLLAPQEFRDNRPKLGRWFDIKRFPANPFFIPITIGPLLPWQMAPDDSEDGGLWLESQGNRSIQLISSSIVLPIDEEIGAINSLNHAYTFLSERFEPHRISHTGNVYEQILYQEENGHWYPLKLFRNGEIADEEHAMAQAFWKDLETSMKSKKG